MKYKDIILKCNNETAGLALLSISAPTKAIISSCLTLFVNNSYQLTCCDTLSLITEPVTPVCPTLTVRYIRIESDRDEGCTTT